GFVFVGWSTNNGATNPYLTTLTVNGPMSIAPQFTPGKRVHFITSPVGLNVSIDHGTSPTRSSSDVTSCPASETQQVIGPSGFPPLCFGDFDFAPGSAHIITGVSPQLDRFGKTWIFDSWSNGAGANAIYATDNNTGTPDTLTANFVRGAQVSLVTNPPGLPLSVDGRQNWASYNFVWGMGTSHQVSAPATLKDSKGRQYTFQSWSNGAGASQTVTV